MGEGKTLRLFDSSSVREFLEFYLAFLCDLCVSA